MKAMMHLRANNRRRRDAVYERSIVNSVWWDELRFLKKTGCCMRLCACARQHQPITGRVIVLLFCAFVTPNNERRVTFICADKNDNGLKAFVLMHATLPCPCNTVGVISQCR